MPNASSPICASSRLALPPPTARSAWHGGPCGATRVRGWLDIPRSRVMAVGDGRNDIDMLKWASEQGRGVAMGQAPEEVLAVSSERTGTDIDDGVATLFRRMQVS